MGFGSKIGGIAKSLTIGTAKKVMKYNATYQAAKYAVGKMKGKRRAGSTSRTSVDVTLRKRNAAYKKQAAAQYKAKMMKMKGKRRGRGPIKKRPSKFSGIKGMKYTKKNKPVTSIADRMQARRRRTKKKK